MTQNLGVVPMALTEESITTEQGRFSCPLFGALVGPGSVRNRPGRNEGS